MAVMVDAVNRVIDLPTDDIQQAPEFGLPVHLDFLLGMVNVDEKLIVLLDVSSVLSSAELRSATGRGTTDALPVAS